MNRVSKVVWSLVIGLGVVMPSVGAGADDRLGATVSRNSQTPNAKRQTPAPAVDERPGRTKSLESGAPSDNRKTAPGELVYTPPPPSIGAPDNRVGGSSRGGACEEGDELLQLSVLAPAHTGLTVQEQPSLCWYLSKATRCPVELTIMDAVNEQVTEPLLETRVRDPIRPGVQCARLADYGVRLAPGVTYEWFVALVADPEHRSQDVIARGAIKRIELPEMLRTDLVRGGTTDAPRVYAAAGLWYDALNSLSDLLAAAPQEPVFQQQRAALLKQGGLAEIVQ